LFFVALVAAATMQIEGQISNIQDCSLASKTDAGFEQVCSTNDTATPNECTTLVQPLANTFVTCAAAATTATMCGCYKAFYSGITSVS